MHTKLLMLLLLQGWRLRTTPANQEKLLPLCCLDHPCHSASLVCLNADFAAAAAGGGGTVDVHALCLTRGCAASDKGCTAGISRLFTMPGVRRSDQYYKAHMRLLILLLACPYIKAISESWCIAERRRLNLLLPRARQCQSCYGIMGNKYQTDE